MFEPGTLARDKQERKKGRRGCNPFPLSSPCRMARPSTIQGVPPGKVFGGPKSNASGADWCSRAPASYRPRPAARAPLRGRSTGPAQDNRSVTSQQWRAGRKCAVRSTWNNNSRPDTRWPIQPAPKKRDVRPWQSPLYQGQGAAGGNRPCPENKAVPAPSAWRLPARANSGLASGSQPRGGRQPPGDWFAILHLRGTTNASSWPSSTVGKTARRNNAFLKKNGFLFAPGSNLYRLENLVESQRPSRFYRSCRPGRFPKLPVE